MHGELDAALTGTGTGTGADLATSTVALGEQYRSAVQATTGMLKRPAE